MDKSGAVSEKETSRSHTTLVTLDETDSLYPAAVCVPLFHAFQELTDVEDKVVLCWKSGSWLTA